MLYVFTGRLGSMLKAVDFLLVELFDDRGVRVELDFDSVGAPL